MNRREMMQYTGAALLAPVSVAASTSRPRLQLRTPDGTTVVFQDHERLSASDRTVFRSQFDGLRWSFEDQYKERSFFWTAPIGAEFRWHSWFEGDNFCLLLAGVSPTRFDRGKHHHLYTHSHSVRFDYHLDGNWSKTFDARWESSYCTSQNNSAELFIYTMV